MTVNSYFLKTEPHAHDKELHLSLIIVVDVRVRRRVAYEGRFQSIRLLFTFIFNWVIKEEKIDLLKIGSS